jgi:hypothetical protein
MTRNAYNVLVGKTEGMRPFGVPKREIIILKLITMQWDVRV